MRLGFWVAPQMFRALGLGLLVPKLSPGISQAFAIPTAAGDLLIVFSIAHFIGVADHLTAQWYIPALVGPFMIVAHLACLAALLRSQHMAAGLGYKAAAV